MWSLVLTVLFVKFYFYYSRLTKEGKKESLIQVIDTVLAKEDVLEKKIDELVKQCTKLEEEGKLYVQKIGLIRFNPFQDTGGDQSFILALVDANDTGVVISSLHTRSGTRWYAKKVTGGKGIEHNLSEEEKKAIKEALSLKNTA